MYQLISIVILIITQITHQYIWIQKVGVVRLQETIEVSQKVAEKGEQRAKIIGTSAILSQLVHGLRQGSSYLKWYDHAMPSTSRVVSVIDNRKNSVNGLVVLEKDPLMHTRASSFIDGIKNICTNGEKRGEMGKIMRKYLQADVYPLVEGFLLGGSSNLSSVQKNEVKRAGVSHLLSASGSNVSLVLVLNSPLLWKRFGRFFTGLFGVIAVVAYVLIAGCSAPLLRAASSSTLAIAASLFNHQATSLRVLLVSCAMMVLVSPHFLTSVGFQLSVAATLGICLFSKHSPNKRKKNIDASRKMLKSIDWQSLIVTARWHKANKVLKHIANSVGRSCRESFGTTLAAQVFTLPIILYHFHELSIVVLVSNVALLWLMPFIITVTVLLLIAAVLHLHILAVMLGIVTSLFVRVFTMIVHFFGSSDKVLVIFSQSQAHRVVFVYLLSILILFVMHKWTRERSTISNT